MFVVLDPRIASRRTAPLVVGCRSWHRAHARSQAAAPSRTASHLIAPSRVGTAMMSQRPGSGRNVIEKRGHRVFFLLIVRRGTSRASRITDSARIPVEKPFDRAGLKAGAGGPPDSERHVGGEIAAHDYLVSNNPKATRRTLSVSQQKDSLQPRHMKIEPRHRARRRLRIRLYDRDRNLIDVMCAAPGHIAAPPEHSAERAGSIRFWRYLRSAGTIRTPSRSKHRNLRFGRNGLMNSASSLRS